MYLLKFINTYKAYLFFVSFFYKCVDIQKKYNQEEFNFS
jgi:hypothetical protein